MDEYEEQIFELRSKLETKLFESLPDVRVGHDIEQLSNSQFGNPYQQTFAQIQTQPIMQPHKATVPVEAHLDIIQRIQKLELATNRLIADSGNVGEGFKSIALTSKENLQNLEQ